ncbi:MAG TPA: IclR family transcriptional regulator [Microlunatus sp.]
MAQPSTEPRSGTVQSVERVFELLEIIADAGGEASLSDLAATSELPMPTIHRLLRTCVLLGYARQLPSRRYALGARLIPLGERAGRQLGRVAQPKLVELVRQLGETANMALMDGDQIVYVAQQPSPHAMRMFTEVGRRANLHDTGVGKAILATLSDDEVRRIVARTGMATPTPKSHGTVESLLTDLAGIRRRGFSIDDEEQELGVRCYAVSIPKAPAPMAVSVSGPLSRVDEAFGDRAVPVLRAIADRVSTELIN